MIKVGDFGLVTTLTEEEDCDNSSRPLNVYRKHTDQVGTQLYMSTEQVTFRHICNENFVWIWAASGSQVDGITDSQLSVN